LCSTPSGIRGRITQGHADLAHVERGVLNAVGHQRKDHPAGARNPHLSGAVLNAVGHQRKDHMKGLFGLAGGIGCSTPSGIRGRITPPVPPCR